MPVRAANPLLGGPRQVYLLGADGGGVNTSFGNLQVKEGAYGATVVTSVAASATTVTLASVGVGGIVACTVYNDSTVDLYLKIGSGASTTSFTVKIPGGGYWEMPSKFFTLTITGVWASATGNARITYAAFS